MKTEHPITPPPELVEQWAIKSPIQHSDETWAYELFIAHQAARWGSDQELEACIQYFHEYDPSWGEDSELIAGLRSTLRPKPPSLKEQALSDFDGLMSELDGAGNYSNCAERIRRALEQLDD